jgi:transcriptional regulator with XRE-family HTH domain
MTYLSAADSQKWIAEQLERSGLHTLENLARVTGVNKGTLSKYFTHKQRPSIDVVAVLCGGLGISPSEVLYGLGAIEGPGDVLSEISTPKSVRT